jgi:hypothetical protein
MNVYVVSFENDYGEAEYEVAVLAGDEDDALKKALDHLEQERMADTENLPDGSVRRVNDGVILVACPMQGI